MNFIKKLSSQSTPEDEIKILQDDLQKLTDSYIETISEKAKIKKMRFYKYNSFKMNNSKQNFFSFAKHVGIIMDGNRRWAKLNGLKNIEGHKKGATNVKEIMKVAITCKIKYLTLFAFSSENWKRTNQEIQDLISLLRFFKKTN